MAEYGVNLLLMGTSGFALSKIPPKECPYAFSACCIGFCHGLFGVLAKAMDDNEDVQKCRKYTKAWMELVPLPLVNMELYYMSSTPNLAVGHGLFIVPLVGELIFNDNEETYSTLKELTIIGNIVSLTFLAINESSYMYAGMAAVAALSRYGGMFMENQKEGTGDNVSTIFDALFFLLTALTVGDGMK